MIGAGPRKSITVGSQIEMLTSFYLNCEANSIVWVYLAPASLFNAFITALTDPLIIPLTLCYV
ncbi:hypothetical protein VCRA2119O240_230101 [Vibrio crassostreae]|nr:hypothetical protein VCRA2118O236_160105 [Vibrio crassostreae]CAK1925013.1 hypothetical protein VCRA2110O181_220006 [Vibrio crassostreae]CAK1933000.1 hypothetical protein VCRA2110O180_220100 [Vibrio crassostreae]CAK1937663.1 hypothetical protein VCRA2113O220_230006 [Vibrio crassostreae]CAK1947391.1 hypothetical protein VCRA2110O172_230101 [Vibrio crassostreae]